MGPRTHAGARRAMALAGLLLAGQGALVLLRVLDHEAPFAAGVLLVILGGGLLLFARRDLPEPPAAPADRTRSLLVALLGAAAVAGVIGYNLVRGSSYAPPEWGILAYGVFLLAAAPNLHRRVGPAPVAALVAYSFPLVLAPLALWAVNAALLAGAGGTPMRWYMQHTLVRPMAAALSGLGLDTSLSGDTIRLATSRGPLFLTVGVVCAGIYATILFLGVFALFAWERRPSLMRLTLYLLVGVVGLHVANLARLVLLGLVGWRWGGETLQAFHQHAGWVLFLLWGFAFWWLVLRRLEPRLGPGAPGA